MPKESFFVRNHSWSLAKAPAAALPPTQAAAQGADFRALVGEVVRLFSEDTDGVKADIHCFLLDESQQEVAGNDPGGFTAFDSGPRERWLAHAAQLAAHAFTARQKGALAAKIASES